MPRVLSEQEFNAVKQRVMAAAPDGLDEAGFQKYIGPALDQAISDAENGVPHIGAAPPAQPKPQSEGPIRATGRLLLDTLPGVGGIVGGALSTPETLGAGTVPGVALGVAAGQGARDLIGHVTGLDEPTTPTDKAKRIARAGVEAGVTGAVLPGIVAAVRSPIATAQEASEQFASAMPPWIRRLGRLIPAPAAKPPAPILERPAWQTWGEAEPAPAPQEQPPAQPTLTLRGQKIAPNRSGVPSAMASREELAAAVEAGELPKSVLDAYDARFPQPVASHAPTLPEPAGGPGAPIQAEREATGAARVARGRPGVTTQDVREAVGPRLNEQRGEASPVLPDDAFMAMFEKLKAMPKEGTERDAYIQAAKDVKTQAQLFNMKRALQNLGLGVGGAALMREAILNRLMASHAPTGGSD